MGYIATGIIFLVFIIMYLILAPKLIDNETTN